MRKDSKNRIQKRGCSAAPVQDLFKSSFLLENKFDPNKKEKTIQWFGIDNKSGNNNCFLNVVLQSIWHLTKERGLREYIMDVVDNLNEAQTAEADLKTKQPLVGIIDAVQNFYSSILKQKETSMSKL